MSTIDSGCEADTGASPRGLHWVRAGRGPLVVLVHELGGSLASLDGVAAALRPIFTVLRYDQRGHGRSVRVADGYDLENQILDLQDVLAAAGHRGAFWLLTVAAASPMAVTLASRSADVGGLVLCSPAVAMDEQRAAGLCARADEVERDGMAVVVDSSLERSYPPEVRGDGAAFARYRSAMLENDPRCYAQANRALAATRTAETARRLRCPVLCIAGRHDRVRPPALIRELAASIPDSQFAEIEGAHLLPYQNPTTVAALAGEFIVRRSSPRLFARGVLS
ncbi:alpha/beta fold hydrolase [Rhodoplanes sp. TEM]|uniref:Alpha/beta fold hydrolase n=1 Tax=Rhodoplanes tepidamans TaxID=200616 RepID=A0ABT5JCF3_RHOTP|nr:MULTISPECIES: alpha/beta fold hydrolase [Rhodoplanes]MDC7787193.1 alpha/beta fold hydrolase [Rhodoplanes tepidamans]MDC7984243.1 alpha/beta fold hydrolase [Rhodoplanes sp. TEM]MDQ0356040.1 3-oxoadipate enol-lactonase [Rhodoplanes tepidamans]